MSQRMVRSVTVRLPSEEYDALWEECLASGRRSISEYVRSILFHRTVPSDYVEFHERVRELESDIRTLRHELTNLPKSRLKVLENEIRALRKGVTDEPAASSVKGVESSDS